MDAKLTLTTEYFHPLIWTQIKRICSVITPTVLLNKLQICFHRGSNLNLALAGIYPYGVIWAPLGSLWKK